MTAAAVASVGEVRERPILFSAPMVRAILAGAKTQTRRVLKPLVTANLPTSPGNWRFECDANGYGGLVERGDGWISCTPLPRAPYGVPGERLWLRETWRYSDWTEDGYPFIGFRVDGSKRICERVDPSWSDRLTDVWAKLSEPSNYNIDNTAADRVWRPAIFMPRWASRITLEVTGVRVERLQDISEADARAEGVAPFHEAYSSFSPDQCITSGERVADFPYRSSFACLWDEINGDRALWSSNPWVWVVEFRRLP